MNTPREQLQQAFQLQMAGKTREAGAAYRDILEDYPDHPEATRLLGLVALQEKRAEDALPLLRKAADLAPANPLPWDHLSEAMILLNRAEEAADCAEAAVSRGEGNPQAHPQALLRLASVRLRLKQLDAAEAAYDRLAETQPDFPGARSLEADLLYQRGRLEEAAAILLQLRQGAQPEADPQVLLGQALFALQRPGEISELPPPADLRTSIGELVLQVMAAWEREDWDNCQEGVQLVTELQRRCLRELRNPLFDSLFLYLRNLIAYRETRPEFYQNPPPGEVVVLGDHHALAAEGVVAAFKGQKVKLRSKAVLAASAAALASGQGPSHAATLMALDKVLPGASVAFFFGNLDCRLSEGLLPELRDLPPEGQQAEIARVAGGYVAEVAREAKQRQITAIVLSPAPKLLDMSAVQEAERDLFARINSGFVEALAAASTAQGLEFVDLHARLRGADGQIREDCYFDRHRLRPHLFAEVFKGL